MTKLLHGFLVVSNTRVCETLPLLGSSSLFCERTFLLSLTESVERSERFTVDFDWPEAEAMSGTATSRERREWTRARMPAHEGVSSPMLPTKSLGREEVRGEEDFQTPVIPEHSVLKVMQKHLYSIQLQQDVEGVLRKHGNLLKASELSDFYPHSMSAAYHEYVGGLEASFARALETETSKNRTFDYNLDSFLKISQRALRLNPMGNDAVVVRLIYTLSSFATFQRVLKAANRRGHGKGKKSQGST